MVLRLNNWPLVREATKAEACPNTLLVRLAYDLRKCRGKNLVQLIPKSRRYRVRPSGIRTLAALLILREKVLKPVLAGICRPKRGRLQRTSTP